MSACAVTLPAVNDQLTWIDRIIDVTGWRHEPEGGAGWEQVEAELGVTLPSDFKDLCRRFVPGLFMGVVDLLRPNDDHDSTSLLGWWNSSRRWMSEDDDPAARLYAPHGLYGPEKGSGLIEWGHDSSGGQYFWLADRSVESDRWPVIARHDPPHPWHRFDMSVTEFVYRMLADPELESFSMVTPTWRPFYLPYWQPFPSTPEEWEALGDPNREN
ncbi:hypothetical protein PSN01_05897 [Micromonospora saelicesensis]|uniref:hypothetical protein n=1 Tax=Micromonospora saelicesensis TaxID=285676 RepID=UPI000DC40D4B|nr:hypothetical protein PSN01_05897 [Micromonospora saelicesensis]